MTVALETRRGPDQSKDRLSEFNTRLYQALEIEPDNPNMGIRTLFPPETFESAEDMHKKSVEISEKIAESWQNPNTNSHYKPSPNDLLQGLTDFAVLATQTLHQALPKVPRVDIEVAMIVVGTRIRSLVIDSEDRRRNTRTERDLFANLYREKLSMMWAREESNL